MNVTISNHLRDIPEFTGSWSVKYELMPDAGREDMTAAWKAWMEETSEHNQSSRFCAYSSISYVLYLLLTTLVFIRVGSSGASMRDRQTAAQAASDVQQWS